MTDIGLVGYAGSGKDTVANILCREYDYTRVAFADPLRKMLKALNPHVPYYDTIGYGPYHAYVERVGYERAKKNPHVRGLLQRLGTEAGRNILGEDVWVDHAMKVADGIDGPVVFTDCRFENEVARIQKRGGRIVVVSRPGVEAPNAHSSETLPERVIADYHIRNDGNLNDLGKAVQAVIQNIRLPIAAVG